MIGLICSGSRAQASASSTVIVLGTGRVEVCDKLGQLLALPPELEAERAAHAQVVLQMLGQRAHDPAPLGQGRAIVRSRSTSTRA